MEEKYKRYADLLNSHLQACESTLAKARPAGCARARGGEAGAAAAVLQQAWSSASAAATRSLVPAPVAVLGSRSRSCLIVRGQAAHSEA